MMSSDPFVTGSALRASTEDSALRRIARDERTPGDYYADKAADVLTLREALALAESEAADWSRRAEYWANSTRRNSVAKRDHAQTNARLASDRAARVREALERALYVGD